MEVQDQDPSGDEQPDNRKRNIIIVVCVAAVILALAIPILVLRGDKDNSPSPLEVVQEQVGALEAKVGTLELNVATHTEDIVDIENDVDDWLTPVDWGLAIDNLEDDVALLWAVVNNLPNVSGNITVLEIKIAVLQAQIVDILVKLAACNCTG